MNIPFGKRQLVIHVEQGPAEFAQEVGTGWGN